MAVHVQTNDSAALTDSDLDELASMDGAFGIGELSKAKEDWVLATTARIDGKLHGFTFSTLERIGGTPCVLIGLMSVRRTSKRDQVLRGLMAEAYHRALMAFPDEDVVVGSRFVGARRPRRVQGARRRHAQSGLAGGRRGTGVGPPPGQALRRRERLRREVVRRRRARPRRLHRLRVGQAGVDRRCPPRAVRAGPGDIRCAHRVRLDDGGGPRQARHPHVVPWPSSPRSSARGG